MVRCGGVMSGLLIYLRPSPSEPAESVLGREPSFTNNNLVNGFLVAFSDRSEISDY